MLIIIIAHELKLSRNVKMYMFPQAVSRYCMIYFDKSPKKVFRFLEKIIYINLTLKILIFCFYFMDYHFTF